MSQLLKQSLSPSPKFSHQPHRDTFIPLQHRRAPMAGAAQPACGPKTAQSRAPAEMGRRELTCPGREPSVIITGSFFPFLRGEYGCSQLGKRPKPQHLEIATSLL